MCLAVPHQIVSLFGKNRAIARAGNVKVEIRTDLLEDPKEEEWVLVHAGFAIEKLEGDEAKEINEIWEELLRARPD